VYVDTFELRAPVAPTALAIDPSFGPDRLQVSWTKSTSPDAGRPVALVRANVAADRIARAAPKRCTDILPGGRFAHSGVLANCLGLLAAK
jgi:hypothetical protein